MNNMKHIKKALLSSALALVVCFTMLVGTTFAWFTDSVTSAGNIIQTGELKVGMYWAEGGKAVPDTDAGWKDASTGAIFNNTKWEPGYTEAKHIKIANEGTLALKYQMRILANGVVSELANVIDVYYYEEAMLLTDSNYANGTKLGTLSEVLNNTEANAISKVIAGSLEEDESNTITLALHMQETAGNEYQNLSIGTDFSIQILATQLASENDSLGNDYDEGADFAPEEIPSAMVSALNAAAIAKDSTGLKWNLDAGYQFEPTETLAQAEKSDYRWYHVDFEVSADHDVKADSLGLAGYYSEWCETLNEGNWLGFTAPDVAANTSIRLLGTKAYVNYMNICEFGNDGIGFRCGIVDLDDSNAGTTVTVKLNLYEVENANDPADASGSHNNEVDDAEPITVGVFTYTFGGAYTTLDDGSVVFMADKGEIWLTDVSNVNATEYYVPDGVTTIGSEIFSANSNIKTVVIPDTVTDFGGTENAEGTGASGGAFKKSAVEKIVLPEGMTEIPAAAFQQAANLTQINIPSTVKKIGINALANIGITELTVPATVEKIGYGAFRGNTQLTTVTIEVNAEISNYAFRTCPVLTDIYLYGDDVTFTGANMAFTLTDNGKTTGMTLHCKNATVAARAVVAQNGTDYVSESWKLDLDGKTYSTTKVVKESEELANAISKTPEADAKFIVIDNGTYGDDINFTVATQGGQKGDLYIKAADGATATFSGTTTLGLYERGTTNVSEWKGSVIFDGITFDHADAEKHSIVVENVEYFEMRNCTVIGDGEYGIGSNSGCKAFDSHIINCTFENAGIQVLGNFGTGLVIDGCTFNNSRVNVQSGNGVTIQNCEFNATLTDTNVGESFYLVRGSSNGSGINVTVKNCEINIDSKVTDIATSQEKWGALWNRGTVTPWTLENITITLTDAAAAQTELIAIKTAGASMNCTNVTVNGVEQ